MIDVKVIVKPKSNGSASGITTNGNSTGTNVAKEAAHAAKADLAGYADKAGYADNAGTASEATHAAKAYDLDDNSPVRDEFLSKIADDVAAGKITFKQGLISLGLAVFSDGAQFGTFVKSLYAGTGSGGYIDGNGNAELQSLILRAFLEVPELRYNRVTVQAGNRWRAAGGGVVE